MKNRQKIWQPETAAYKRFHFPVHAKLTKETDTQKVAEKPASVAPARKEPAKAPADQATSPPTQHQFNTGYEKGKKEGYRKGLEEGRLTGLDEGKHIGLEQGRIQNTDQQAAFVEVLQQQLAQVRNAHLQNREELVLWLGRVVEETCRQVVRRELSTETDHIVHVIKETLNLMPEEDQYSIHLSPHDAEQIKQLKPDMGVAWQIVEDRTVTQGDCRIVSSETEAEARMESRLVECLDIIRETLPVSIQEVS